MKAKCTRGFYSVVDPETNEEIIVQDEFEVSEEQFNRLDANYSGMEIVEEGPEEFICGVNDCGRTGEDPEFTCWQHQETDKS